MKIAHLVLSNVYAGIEQHVNELISEQQKTCEVTLICNSQIKDKFDCSNIIVVKNFSRNSPLGLFKLLLLIKKIDIDYRRQVSRGGGGGGLGCLGGLGGDLPS